MDFAFDFYVLMIVTDFLGRMGIVHCSNLCCILHLLAWLWLHAMCLVKFHWGMCFGESPYVFNIQCVLCFLSLIFAEQPRLHQYFGILYGLIIQTPNSCFQALRFIGNKFIWILHLTSMFLWLWLIFLGRMGTVHCSNLCCILHLMAWLWSNAMCLVKFHWDVCFGE